MGHSANWLTIFRANRKDNSGFRQVVYQVHDFSQSTSSPTKWLKEQAVQAGFVQSRAY